MEYTRVDNRVRHDSIARLNVDVLWTIFSVNTLTDSNFTDPITSETSTEVSIVTARHTSQVCALWRSISMASPNIWANVINMRHLQQKADHWRNEILKRTGNLSLSVIAENLRKNDPGNPFFFSLVRSEGARIRRIYTSSGYWKGVAGDYTWKTIFLQESPHLEIINFNRVTGAWVQLNSHSPRTSATPESATVAALFGDSAPMLRIFKVRGIDADLFGSWNLNIRCLDLQDSNFGQSLFPTLMGMHQLEALYCVNCTMDSTKQMEISLPRLRQLSIEGVVEFIIPWLSNLPPSRLLTYIIKVKESETRDASTEASDRRFIRALAPHMKGRFMGDLDLDVTSVNIDFSNMLPFSPSLYSQTRAVRVSVDVYWDILPRLLLDMLRDICHPSSVTRASLRMSSNLVKLLEATITRFLSALSFVEILYTFSTSLEAVTNLLAGAFPHLHTLILQDESGMDMSLHIIRRFIEERHSVGLPVRNIDLSRCSDLNDSVVSYLCGVDGLNVIWSADDVRSQSS